MSGRGHSNGNKGQDPLLGQSRGRRNGYSQQPLVPAQAPATPAWGPAAPPPITSAWGAPQQPQRQAQSQQPHGSSQQPQRPAQSPQLQRQAQSQQPQRSSHQQQRPGPSEQPRTADNNGGEGASGGGSVERSVECGYVPANGGSTRRKYIIPEVIHTKPKDLQTKCGTTGQVVPLVTNHFRLLKKPSWQLYQYRVDFSPTIENYLFKKKLIQEQKPNFGGYLFDGTMLFLTSKLVNVTTEYMKKDRDDNPIQILVKYITLVSMNTAVGLQVLNLILRHSMGALDLQLVGRNFFDALAKIDIPQFSLQLWPGYITSIRQHEVDILLCAEITNKVMRTETVWDILRTCATNRNDRNYKGTADNLIVGMTVLTAYNNKTYRVTDIDYDRSPESTFTTKNGDMSFMDYYRKKYHIEIKDRNQPLIVSKSSDRKLRSGEAVFIELIPELCRATGLTDRMTSDYKLMSAVAAYTRLPPGPRIDKLLAFNRRLHGQDESMTYLREWNFGLDQNLVELKGRCLPR